MPAKIARQNTLQKSQDKIRILKWRFVPPYFKALLLYIYKGWLNISLFKRKSVVLLTVLDFSVTLISAKKWSINRQSVPMGLRTLYSQKL